MINVIFLTTKWKHLIIQVSNWVRKVVSLYYASESTNDRSLRYRDNIKAIDVFSESRKPKTPGKWDAIMSTIAEKKSGIDLATRVRDVKSKVFADFRPPIIRTRNPTPENRKNESEKFSRSNSAMSSRPPLMTSRSNSTVSARGEASGAVSR